MSVTPPTYWIPMFGVPCYECSYPAAYVVVGSRGREIVHTAAQRVGCAIPNPERSFPLCPNGHLRSPDNLSRGGRCQACITTLSHARSKGAAA